MVVDLPTGWKVSQSELARTNVQRTQEAKGFKIQHNYTTNLGFFTMQSMAADLRRALERPPPARSRLGSCLGWRRKRGTRTPEAAELEAPFQIVIDVDGDEYDSGQGLANVNHKAVNRCDSIQNRCVGVLAASEGSERRRCNGLQNARRWRSWTLVCNGEICRGTIVECTTSRRSKSGSSFFGRRQGCFLLSRSLQPFILVRIYRSQAWIRHCAEQLMRTRSVKQELDKESIRVEKAMMLDSKSSRPSQAT